MKVCSICKYEVEIVVGECPNCGADLTALKPEVQTADLMNTNYIARALPLTPTAENLPNLEKDIEHALKGIEKALKTGDFTGALSKYRSVRQKISARNNQGYIAGILDILKQSIDILIKQKQQIATLERRRPATSSSCSRSLAGRLAWIPILILAGIGGVSLLAQGASIFGFFAASSPTPSITPEPQVTPVVEVSPTPFPDTFPISADNVESVRELYTWSVGENVVSLAFSPDGVRIATSDSTGTIKVWRLWTQEILMELPGSYASFSPDGRWIGTAGETGVAIYDSSTGQNVRAMDEGRTYYSVVFSPDSQLIAGGTDYGNFYIWSVNDGEMRQVSGGLEGEVSWLSFSGDGSLLAAASTTRTYAWSLRGKKIGRDIVYPEKNKPFFSGVALDRDGDWYAASTGEGRIVVWRISNGETMTVLSDGGSQIKGLQYLNGSNFPEVLVSGNEANLTFWTIEEYNHDSRTINVSIPIQSLAVSADNRLISTGGNDGVVHLWGVVP